MQQDQAFLPLSLKRSNSYFPLWCLSVTIYFFKVYFMLGLRVNSTSSGTFAANSAS